MSDAAVLPIARALADALMECAHERSDAARKEVARLNMELCAAVRSEREPVTVDAETVS